MTSPANAPGDRPRLDRPPSDRYGPPSTPVAAGDGTGAARLDAALGPVGLVLGAAIAFTLLGGLLSVTAGLIILAAFLGWLTGRLVSPAGRAALVGLVAVAAGFAGIWAFGRIEGGVLDPIAYLIEVEGPTVVVLCFLAGGGLAAAASR